MTLPDHLTEHQMTETDRHMIGPYCITMHYTTETDPPIKCQVGMYKNAVQYRSWTSGEFAASTYSRLRELLLAAEQGG